jgi:hypothetical protein
MALTARVRFLTGMGKFTLDNHAAKAGTKL